MFDLKQCYSVWKLSILGSTTYQTAPSSMSTKSKCTDDFYKNRGGVGLKSGGIYVSWSIRIGILKQITKKLHSSNGLY